MESRVAQFLSLNKENKLTMDLESLKYPVGKYEAPTVIDDEIFAQWISTIEALPDKIKELVANLSYTELDLHYRPGGWTIKQVVHHLADSHMNSFIRFKLMMTEDNPTIRPYDEKEWAETADANNEEITDSLEILEGLHKRWATLLKSINPKDRKRPFIHPEYDHPLALDWMLGNYDWHCRHHLGHIQQAIKLEGKFTTEEVK